MSFQNLIDANLVVANVIPQVKEFIITFPSTGYYPSEITWNIKRSDGTAVINGTPTTNIGTQNVSSTELTYDGSYVLNMFDSYGTWNGYAIAVSSTDASGNTYTRVTDNTGPASGGTLPTSASVNLNEFTITPKTEVVRADLQSMIALGHTIPELVAGNIYTNQLIKDEFSGADVLELATSSYGSLGIEDLQNLGYTNSELTGYFELWIQLGGDINGEAFEDYSGYSVSLSSDGTIVAIGAIGNDGTNTEDINDNRGHVRVYQYSSDSWTQLSVDIDGDGGGDGGGDQSGKSVSLSSDGTNVAIGSIYNDGTANAAGHVRVYNLNTPATPVAICFPAGTPVTTDQGNIPIEKLKSHIHTIRGKSIVAITKTKLLQKYIVSIKKEALSKNVPLQTTHISRSHKIFFKGCMIKAEELVDVCENVHFIPYNGETLYNVLLEKEGKMMINNLICETLSPNNIVAVISRISDKTEKNRNIRKLTSIIMKNDKEEYKKLYLSLLRSSSNTKFNKAH